jgi:nitric oxide reductase NorE protein
MLERRHNVITPAPPSGAGVSPRWVPGEIGIWAFILTDLTVFALYFATFMFERRRDPVTFAHGRDALSATSGALNTALLVTASLFIALAVHAVRRADGQRAQVLLVGAGACGLAFIVNKPIEWGRELGAGHGIHHDNFFQLYYMLTGLHLAHVLVAMVVVIFLWRLAGTVMGSPTPRQLRFIENGASYWHLVDVIWLVLFAIFYLVR